MKIVRENLNEFERSDNSLKNLGIGIRVLISNFMKEIGEEDTDNNALVSCSMHGKIEWVEYLLKNGADVHTNDDLALRWACDQGYIEIVKLLLDAGADVHTRNDTTLRWANKNGRTEVVKILQDWINKKIYEFERSDNSLRNLGISKRALIENWLKKYKIQKYTVNDDLTIDVYDLQINNTDLESFPEYIQFNYAFNCFDISNNKFTTLKGCPYIVYGNFWCFNNNLKTLDFIPKEIVEYNGYWGLISCAGNDVLFKENYVRSLCKLRPESYINGVKVVKV
jgi:hypothetical protein